MSPYRKAALLLVRLTSFGLMLVGGLQLGAHLLLVRAGKTPPDSNLMIAFKSLPLLIGLILLFKGSAIARKLTEDFEE